MGIIMSSLAESSGALIGCHKIMDCTLKANVKFQKYTLSGNDFRFDI